MAKIHMMFKGYRVTALDMILPELITGEASVLWLLHDKDSRGDEFLTHTRLQQLCEENGWYAVCVAVGNEGYRDRPEESHAMWGSFVTTYLWDLLHQMFPNMPGVPEKNYIAGIGMGAEGATALQKEYAHKYGCAVKLAQDEPSNWKKVNEELEQFIEKR